MPNKNQNNGNKKPQLKVQDVETKTNPKGGTRKAGKGQQEFLIIKMNDIIITSVNPSVSGDQPATAENVALQFAKVDLEYKPQKADGSLDVGLHFKYDIKGNKDQFNEYKAAWKGKLKGKIVLISEPKTPKPTEKPLFRRYTDADLARIAEAPEPVVRHNVPLDQLKFPTDEEELNKYFESLPNSVIDQIIDQYFDLINEEGRFFHDEGVVGLIRADRRAHNGLVFAEAAGSHKAADPMAPPTFVVTEEQYSRLTRLIEKKQAVSVRMNLEAKISDTDIEGMDIVGEIPGGRKRDQIVMIGAHFDSWHSGTGATDNGAGSAVMIEVMRILKTLNLKFDRTVRIGLWDGEEEGLFGSKAYVKSHFADPKTMQVRPEHAKLDAYLNLDNGSGKIRGVYLQGNDAARPLFDKWMAPFRDLGVTTTSLKDTGGTDHLSFDEVGLPGFQFIQDPMEYSTRTHHSNMDVYDHIQPGDLMQQAGVLRGIPGQRLQGGSAVGGQRDEVALVVPQEAAEVIGGLGDRGEQPGEVAALLEHGPAGGGQVR